MGQTTASAMPLSASRRTTLWREIRRNWVAYVYISPFFILFAIFGAFPIFFSFVLSFHQWNAITPPQWVGLDNYVRLFQDRLFWLAMWNTIFIGVIAHIPILGGAMVLAFIINSAAVRFKHFYRSAYFLPVVTSPVAVSLIFSTLYGVRFGLINWVLVTLGLPPIDWWGGNGEWIKPAIIILFIWRWLGWNMIIYLAGLQGINPELYEVAAIDGANLRQIFFKITLPLMQPIILFTLVLSTVGAMTIFDEPYLLVGTTGGTNNAGLTITMYLYDRGFRFAHLGYASAMAYVVSAVIVFVSVLNIRFFGRSRTEV
ncbi:carbohydrate ABC transporter permease [Caldilinea sp.]|jgi:ABC-type sugar transport system permease subunit|uniref:carbohydrate ABC transporter permease n=1 Tax=Caldilinea sp. TaxID=2293560 RepID=UPI0021DD34F5|nr:sugar ABC transporter permease [Caldilinea sp.]GIV69699.1 MAG: cytochrome c biogenesis protein [Caldilinea sp.]